MLQLDVYVGLEGRNRIVVNPELAAAHSGEPVLWNVYCLDKNVEYVEIDFRDADDEFFVSRDSGKLSKKCHAKLRGGSSGRQGNVVGSTPTSGDKGAKQRKYWIRAYSADPGSGAKHSYEIDPTIVTVDP